MIKPPDIVIFMHLKFLVHCMRLAFELTVIEQRLRKHIHKSVYCLQ